MGNRKKKRSSWRRKLSRYFLVLFLAALVLLVGAWAILPSLLEPHLKSILIKQGSESVRGDVVIGELTLRSVAPFSLRARQVQVTRTDGTLQVLLPEVDIDVGFTKLLNSFPMVKLDFRMLLKDPFFRMTIFPGKEEPKQQPVEPSSFPQLIKFDSSLDIQITRGQVEVVLADEGKDEADQTRLQLKNIGLLVQLKSLFNNANPMTLNLNFLAGVKMGDFITSTPVQVSSNEIYTSEQMVEAKRINVDFGGLVMAAAGSTSMEPLQHNWLVRFQVPELSQLKVPPQFLPPGVWAGAMSGKIHFAQKANAPPYVGVQARVQGIRGDTEWTKDNMQVKGGVVADARIDAVYWEKWQFKDFYLTIDLSGARLTLDPWLKKNEDERLRFQIAAKQEGNGFRIDKGELEFTRLKAFAKGLIQSSPEGVSNLQVRVPKVNLRGFEKYFPFLKNQTLQGSLEVNGKLAGNLTKPESLAVDLSPLKLNGVSAMVNYTNKKTRVHAKGPIHLTANVELSAQGSQLNKAKATIAADLSRMSISVADQFRKMVGQTLSLRLNANKKGDRVVIHHLALEHPAGSLTGQGTVRQPQKPIFDVSLGIDELNLRSLSRLVPPLAAYGVSGKVEGKIKGKGTYDFALGVEKSLMSLDGQLSASIPKVIVPMPDPKANPDQGIAPEVQPKPLLPDWPLFNNSKMKINLQVRKLMLGKSTAEKMATTLTLAGGNLKGGVSIASIFGGSARLTQLVVPMRQILPVVPMKVDLRNIDLNRAITWYMPEKRDFVKGKATLNTKVSVPWPGPEGWWKTIRADGKVDFANFFMSSLDFDQKINEALAKLPGRSGKKRVKSKGVAAALRTQFKAKDGKIEIKDLLFKTPEKNELAAAGKVGFDLKGSLKGELRLANPPVKGSVKEANSDEQGRLIIPVEIKGDLTNPSFGIATHIIEKMLAKTLAYEKRKAVKKVETKAKSEVKKVAEKEKKKLKQSIDKKIKGLFKRK